MDKVIIVKDVVIEVINTKQSCYEVVTFKKDKPKIDSIDEVGLIEMCQKTETVDIHKFCLNNDLFRFGMTKDAEKKLPILSLMNILIDEKEYLQQQLTFTDKKIIDLTFRLEDYEKSKIIKFLRFIKIF